MKIKILIAPALIIFAIWMSIWVINPEYGKLKDDKQKLTESLEKLSEIQEKNRKIEKLSQDLSANAEAQEIILRYIPSDSREEEVVDNINYLASHEGISLYQMSIESKKSEQLAEAPFPEASAPFVSGASSGSSSDGVVAQEAPKKAKPKEVLVKIGLVGTYDKIRSLTNKLATLRRFNRIDSMKIEKEESDSSEEKKSSAGILKAESVIAFNYLEKVASINNINDKIFFSDKFDTSVIDDIKNKMNTSLVDLEMKAGGRENPFIPNK